ncbi:uncharacterized protein LOC131233341 [Magnolia sinica]|uniref:uncharacterized protein LOC131233341 n=1 Tax=Magnolia sinica TaxID=86752 RepID=UPI002658E3BD|nr:uncharacterized protein LOC131233341 [Magnolia sinica]XP_058086016.1 uncharacterized protein LOC131233341 [Magnolia sinica]XP_058086017.1 uncharacterized protein LOC131233341 [Magnolia sinica]
MDFHQHIALCKRGMLKGVVAVMALVLAAFILGPPLYWHVTEGFATLGHASFCPPCICECASQPLLSVPEDCGKRNLEVNEETERGLSDLLMEELKLKEAEALEKQQHVNMVVLEAKKAASQYQKEADKCNFGMESCEEAREKAEDALLDQKRQSTMWEMRARQRGWKE